MSNFTHDILILGGGPGGYVAAIRAAQLGLDAAVIDENQQWGGTCLRVGCIPSKALLESSHLFEEAQQHFAEHGIKTADVSVDLEKMMQRKSSVVDALTGGIKMLLKKNKVKAYNGRGQFVDKNTIEITGKSAGKITAKNIVIATGSLSFPLPGVEFDDNIIGDSTTALSYDTVPETLIVIGGGYIGLELGSVWSRLGAKVTILEAQDRILPGLDNEIAKIAHRIFSKQGLEFKTGVWVESAKKSGVKGVVKLKGEDQPLEADRVLVCTGRIPNTANIGLDAIGIETNRGAIPVNERFETKIQGVFAIGDCIGGAMLAHKASEEGVACVEMIAGGHGHVDYNAIPAIVYTNPEIASVGKTEEQLKDEGIEYRKGMCPYGANGRARALGGTDGRIKVLAHATTDRIVGVHAIGARAGDLIAEAAVAMAFGASSEDLARCCHAHPTLSEIMQEAALAVDNRAIHT